MQATRKLRLWIPAFFACLLPLASCVGTQPPDNDLWDAGWKITSDYSLKDDFDAAELKSLAGKPARNHDENRRMMLLLLHAGIKKDNSFQNLLKKPELRKETNVDLALSAYDYMTNASPKALDRILEQLATEQTGSDSDAIVVLSVVDEWDKSVKAFKKHFTVADGAGGICRMKFLTTRAYLYPEHYAKAKATLDAR